MHRALVPSTLLLVDPPLVPVLSLLASTCAQRLRLSFTEGNSRFSSALLNLRALRALRGVNLSSVEFSDLSRRIIGCAIEVHRVLGPGLLESTYEQCLAHELHLSGIQFLLQHPLPVDYKGIRLDCGYRVDLLVENEVLLELKSVEQVLGIHEAQLITYMKLTGVGRGLLINFNVKRLKDGLKSFVL